MNEILKAQDYCTRGLEFRGIWHMPHHLYDHGYDERTLEGVEKLLDTIQKSGYQVILIETTMSARTIYPSKVGTLHPKLASSTCYYGPIYQHDYLKCFIEESHKRGMKVHAWTTTMRAGRKEGTIEESLPHPIKVEWLARGYHDEYGKTGRYGELLWLDPANEEVMEYLIIQYTELIHNYDFDGFEFDAIRYPTSNLFTSKKGLDDEPLTIESLSDFGYTDKAINGFKQYAKFDGDLKQELLTTPGLKEAWTEYRASLISKVVEVIKNIVLKEKPELWISAAVFVHPTKSFYQVCQNWQMWVEKGWMDFISPMVYTTSNELVLQSYIDTQNVCQDHTLNLQGIAAIIMGGDAENHLQQMDLIMKEQGLGSILFSIRQFLKNPELVERVGEFHQTHQAVNPLDDMKNIIAFVRSRIQGCTNVPMLIDDFKRTESFSYNIEGDWLCLIKLADEMVELMKTCSHYSLIQDFDLVVKVRYHAFLRRINKGMK